jgi:hypothetical protein
MTNDKLTNSGTGNVTASGETRLVCSNALTGTSPQPRRKATYATMRLLLTNALNDLEILAGNRVGPSDASWQDVAGTCAANLQALVWQIEKTRAGNSESFPAFPSPVEILEEADGQ